MSEQKTVVVWSKQGCSYCERVKAYLEDNQVSYQTIDVTNNDDYRDILELKYGIRTVPVVEVGNTNQQTYKAITASEIDDLHSLIFE